MFDVHIERDIKGRHGIDDKINDFEEHNQDERHLFNIGYHR